MAALTEADLPAPVAEQRRGLVVTREEAGAWARNVAALDEIESHEMRMHKYRLSKIAHERKRLEWMRPAVTATVVAEVAAVKAIRKAAKKELEFQFEDSEFEWAPLTANVKVRSVPETIEYVEKEEGQFLAWDASVGHQYTRWKPHFPAMSRSDFEWLRNMVSMVVEPTVTVEPRKDDVKEYWKSTKVVPPGWRLVPAHEELRTEASFKEDKEEGGLLT